MVGVLFCLVVLLGLANVYIYFSKKANNTRSIGSGERRSAGKVRTVSRRVDHSKPSSKISVAIKMKPTNTRLYI